MTKRFTLIDCAHAKYFFQRNGAEDELDFWKQLSGISGTSYDCMHHYLRSLGYTGKLDDMMRVFLQDMTGVFGTTFDKANVFFNTIYPAVSYIETEDGNYLEFEDGTRIEIE